MNYIDIDLSSKKYPLKNDLLLTTYAIYVLLSCFTVLIIFAIYINISLTGKLDQKLLSYGNDRLRLEEEYKEEFEKYRKQDEILSELDVDYSMMKKINNIFDELGETSVTSILNNLEEYLGSSKIIFESLSYTKKEIIIVLNYNKSASSWETLRKKLEDRFYSVEILQSDDEIKKIRIIGEKNEEN